MSFARASALRSLQSTLRLSGARAAPRVRTQLVARRFASSGSGHAHPEPSSDIPWFVGSVAATVVGVYFVLPSSPAAGHGHGHHDEHHDDGKHEEANEDQDQEEEAAQEDSAPAEQSESSEQEEKSNEAVDEAPAKENGEDKAEGEEKKQAQGGDKKENAEKSFNDDKREDKSEKSSESKDEQSEGDKDVQFKGKMRSDSAGHQGETRKTESDSKGAYKKRIDSGLAQNLGAGTTSEKHAGSQEGAANTDTRHSVKIDEPGSEKSTKGEGAPETAKVKGAVDPNRPQK